LHALPCARRTFGAYRARGDLHDRDAAEAVVRLPDHDDLRRRPPPARPARSWPRCGAARDRKSPYDPARSPRPRRLGDAGCDDREAGGSDVRANHHLRRPLNGGGAGGIPAHRAQVVLLGAMSDIFSCSPRPSRPTLCRGLSCFLMPRILPDGRATRCISSASRTSSATARTPPRRSAAGRLEPDGRRARPRRADDHRDGRPHAPGLRDRRRCRMRRRGCAGHAPRRTPQRVRQDTDRPAFDGNVLATLPESEAATALAMRLARAYDEAGNDARRH